jgi:two-component system OmpR family sensor kinase
VTFRPAILGRRLLLRLYLYEAILFAVIVTTVVGIGKVIIEPAMWSDRREGLAWVGEATLAMRHDPAQLQRELASLGSHVKAGVTIYTADGYALAHTGEGPAPPLDARATTRLEHEATITLSPRTYAVAALDGNRLAAYAIVTWAGSEPSAGDAAVILLAVLLVVGLGSIPFAHSIARPLERLSRVTREFGLGDLTARTRVEREDEIGDVSRAFNQMADRVETLRRAEKELLANISHELRTPLARIRVVVELGAEEDPEAAKRYLADIAEDLTEVEQILGDIIATARLDLANDRAKDPYPPLRMTRLPMRALLDSLVSKFREQYPERTLECAFGNTDVTIACDRVMLKHAIGNLLDNAQKYSPANEPIVLHMRAADDGTEVRIGVSDHGVGIDRADAPHVFAPFFRGDRSRSRETGGVGLGLTLARRIIEAHGGTIELRPGDDGGTTVTVALTTLPGAQQSIDEAHANA